jgi:hypothetical protein
MNLSEYLLSGTIINKQAKLLKSIKLNNREIRRQGDVVTIMKRNVDGTYHAEDNGWACNVERNEFKYAK